MATLLGNRMKDRVERREEVVVPTYALKKKRRQVPKWAIRTCAVIMLVFAVFYLPPMMLDEPDRTTRSSVNATNIANIQATEVAISCMRNNPDGDFDGDGLKNEQELSSDTGIYTIDTDNDGTTDYAELFITGTNPNIRDNAIVDFVMQSDSKTGNAVNTPFKIHDVVLWADDYASKARGGVVQLKDGSYNFYRFKGWVQFPGEVAEAYKVVNDVQQALKKNDNGYFYIDDNGLVNVRTYTQKQDKRYIISLLNNRFCVSSNFATAALNFICPNDGYGLIVSRPALANDWDSTWRESSTTNNIVTVQVPEYDSSRFNRDQQSLEDLATIFAEIDNGNNVLISLMSHEVGEVILEVYGYTNRNNLLVADPQTGEEFGVINIDVLGERILDKSGSLVSYEHFKFDGCGFSSNAKHRLMILDTVAAS